MANETTELQAQEAEKQEVTTMSDAERTRARRTFVPRVDIYETEEDIFLVADMPGVDESSIDLTLEKNVLTLEGMVEESGPEDYNLAYAEYALGDYRRSFTLSNQVDQENIEASMTDGVLRLRLPKAGPAKARKIAVKSA